MNQTDAEALFQKGPPNGERFMVIATDTFDGGVFPVFTNNPRETITELRDSLNQVMEVYNFDQPLYSQRRAPSLFYDAAWDLGAEEVA